MCHKKRKEKDCSGNIAMERLKLILDAEKQRLDDDTLRQIHQEIGAVITKYVDIDPDNIEVKVILKEYNLHTKNDIKEETDCTYAV